MKVKTIKLNTPQFAGGIPTGISSGYHTFTIIDKKKKEDKKNGNKDK